MTGILNLSGLHELDLKELEFEYHVKAEPPNQASSLIKNWTPRIYIKSNGRLTYFLRLFCLFFPVFGLGKNKTGSRYFLSH